MSITLFKKINIANINKLLQTYRISVNEKINGKENYYSNIGLKKKTPLYSKYKKKKNSYTNQIKDNDINYYQCLFIDIIIANIRFHFHQTSKLMDTLYSVKETYSGNRVPKQKSYFNS